ncbi:hypothetical protein HMPREF3190_01285 [Umbribacter vaginalis]|nr:hypothetical protein HMPREF3190_01285 [Coriobacteriales bacterium DNF00809]
MHHVREHAIDACIILIGSQCAYTYAREPTNAIEVLHDTVH